MMADAIATDIVSRRRMVLCYTCATNMAAMFQLRAPPAALRPSWEGGAARDTADVSVSLDCRLDPLCGAPRCFARVQVCSSWRPEVAVVAVSRVDTVVIGSGAAALDETAAAAEAAEAAEAATASPLHRAAQRTVLSVLTSVLRSGSGDAACAAPAVASAVQMLESPPPKAARSEDSQLLLLCEACLGAAQFLDAFLVPFIVTCVRCSPFVDSREVALSLGVQRHCAFLWLRAAVEFGRVVSPSGTAPHRNHIVPEAYSNFKEFFCADLRARVMFHLERGAYVVGASAAVDAMLTSMLSLRGLHGDLTTIVTCPNQLVYGDTAGITVSVEVAHPATLELVQPRLPKAYAGNKCDLPVPYSLVYDAAPRRTAAAAAADTASEEGDAALAARIDAALSEPIAAVTACGHHNVFLVGNYRKLARDISQSPWFSGGARVGSYSLQEIIAEQLVPLFFPNGLPPPAAAVAAAESKGRPQLMGGFASPWQSDAHDAFGTSIFGYGSYKFHSAGREDVDVRMLGSGRPFVLEIISPHRQFVDIETELRAAAIRIGASHGGVVEIVDAALGFTDADITTRLARHSESKRKTYRCVCYSSRALLSDSDPKLEALRRTSDLEIVQKTPLRVLHRRSLLARRRIIHSIAAQRLNQHWLIVDLETQAGTYVKEFVHGDLGRTTPSLGALLESVTDIIQLDVLGMVMAAAGDDAAP